MCATKALADVKQRRIEDKSKPSPRTVDPDLFKIAGSALLAPDRQCRARSEQSLRDLLLDPGWSSLHLTGLCLGRDWSGEE